MHMLELNYVYSFISGHRYHIRRNTRRVFPTSNFQTSQIMIFRSSGRHKIHKAIHTFAGIYVFGYILYLRLAASIRTTNDPTQPFGWTSAKPTISHVPDVLRRLTFKSIVCHFCR